MSRELPMTPALFEEIAKAMGAHANLLLEGFGDMVRRYAPDNPKQFSVDAAAWLARFNESLTKIRDLRESFDVPPIGGEKL